MLWKRILQVKTYLHSVSVPLHII